MSEVRTPCVVKSASSSLFPLENLPLGVFETAGLGPRVGVALGDVVVDCRALVRDGLLEADGAHALGSERASLDEYLALEPSAWAATRAALTALLTAGSSLDEARGGLGSHAVPRADARMLMPFTVGDYTDFYSSIDHARNVGTMFRGAANALNPNWTWMPIAYHGRASSVAVSGSADPRRPWGQLAPSEAGGRPSFGPSAQVDYELELGFVIGGPPNPIGEPLRLRGGDAERRIFGSVLVNDWSARDVQRWEYVPLGPFTSKNFLTTISPWVVPLAALEAARCPLREPEGDALEYLALDAAARGRGALDIALEVGLSHRGAWAGEAVVCRGNARTLYWSAAQQVAHHTVTGCNLRPGDLLATGTISGPEPESGGCLLERTWRAERPLPMPDGSKRGFLEDGDTVAIRGVARGPNGAQIGLGECVGTLLPAATGPPV